MKTKKMLAYSIGVICSVTVAIGIVLMLASKPVSITASIIIICLSLASGLISLNPLSLVGLMAGICMLIFPSRIVGLILIVIGVLAAILNVFVSKRKLKLE